MVVLTKEETSVKEGERMCSYGDTLLTSVETKGYDFLLLVQTENGHYSKTSKPVTARMLIREIR